MRNNILKREKSRKWKWRRQSEKKLQCKRFLFPVLLCCTNLYFSFWVETRLVCVPTVLSPQPTPYIDSVRFLLLSSPYVSKFSQVPGGLFSPVSYAITCHTRHTHTHTHNRTNTTSQHTADIKLIQTDYKTCAKSYLLQEFHFHDCRCVT